MGFEDSKGSAESSVPTAAAEGARARACASADADARSTTTTVTLSRLPRSTAARVSTVAAMRAALWREAPRWRARRRQRLASVQASWLESTSHSPSLASSRISSSGRLPRIVTCRQEPSESQPFLGDALLTRGEGIS